MAGFFILRETLKTARPVIRNWGFPVQKIAKCFIFAVPNGMDL